MHGGVHVWCLLRSCHFGDSHPDSLSNLDITIIIDVHDFNNKHTYTRVQDFELELAGAHVMRVQICSKSLLKEETYAHGKIRVRVVSPLFTVACYLLNY